MNVSAPFSLSLFLSVPPPSSLPSGSLLPSSILTDISVMTLSELHRPSSAPSLTHFAPHAGPACHIKSLPGNLKSILDHLMPIKSSYIDFIKNLSISHVFWDSLLCWCVLLEVVLSFDKESVWTVDSITNTLLVILFEDCE